MRLDWHETRLTCTTILINILWTGQTTDNWLLITDYWLLITVYSVSYMQQQAILYLYLELEYINIKQ